MCRARFQHSRFGPMEVRGLWRARRLPGERLVGWGVVAPPPTASQAALQIGLGMIPGIGQIAALAISGAGNGERSLMMLSDRRVLLLSTGLVGIAPDGRGVRLDEALELLEVICDPPSRPRRRSAVVPPAARREVTGGSLVFSLHSLSAAPMKLDLKVTTAAGLRLREGLLLLAGHSGEASAG